MLLALFLAVIFCAVTGLVLFAYNSPRTAKEQDESKRLLPSLPIESPGRQILEHSSHTGTQAASTISSITGEIVSMNTYNYAVSKIAYRDALTKAEITVDEAVQNVVFETFDRICNNYNGLASNFKQHDIFNNQNMHEELKELLNNQLGEKIFTACKVHTVEDYLNDMTKLLILLECNLQVHDDRSWSDRIMDEFKKTPDLDQWVRS